jgi:hypothetical protein
VVARRADLLEAVRARTLRAGSVSLQRWVAASGAAEEFEMELRVTWRSPPGEDGPPPFATEISDMPGVLRVDWRD